MVKVFDLIEKWQKEAVKEMNTEDETRTNQDLEKNRRLYSRENSREARLMTFQDEINSFREEDSEFMMKSKGLSSENLDSTQKIRLHIASRSKSREKRDLKVLNTRLDYHNQDFLQILLVMRYGQIILC